MVVDNSTKRVVVFDTRDDTVVGSVFFGLGGFIAGDCALFNRSTGGFTTDFGSRVWAFDLTTLPPRLAASPNPIPISNPGEDVAFTADGRFLVACDGSIPAPVSVVDTALRTQVATFALGSDCNAVDVCDDGSVLVSSLLGDRIRRLIIGEDGALSDTGEFFPILDPINVTCAPGSGSGIVIPGSGPAFESFTIPGLAPVSTRNRTSPQWVISTAINSAGDRVYVRSDNVVDVFSLDAETGALGDAPLLTIPILTGAQQFFGIDQMALDPAGKKLYVPQVRGIRVHDAVTGEHLRTITDPAITAPIGVCIVRVPDTDDDGLDDDAERAAGTDPLDQDSDDDGLLDGFEVANGFDPLALDEGSGDPDGDSLDNLGEQAARTNPHDPDTDGDGLTDGTEVFIVGSDPRLSDTDADGVGDGTDNCPRTANVGQEDILHPNGKGDACDDPDVDGVPDREDNCPDAANTNQANDDGDSLGNVCDPFPSMDLRVRPVVQVAGFAGSGPIPIRYQLEDAAGALHAEVTGVRATLSLSGAATFGATALEGLLLDGAGTSRAVVEFVRGVVVLAITDSVPEVVALGGEDSQRLGVVMLPRSIRLRSPAADIDSYALVVDNWTRRAVVLDAETDALIGNASFGSGGTAGDCALSAELGSGFLTDTAQRLWVVDVGANPPALAGQPNPVPISIPGFDVALTPDHRFIVSCGDAGFTFVSVVDTVRRSEVSRFAVSDGCNAVDVCDDGSVLMSSFGSSRIRRLTIDGAGRLTDTGEALSIEGPVNVSCAPGSSAGIAVRFVDRRLQSFRIPGLLPVSTRQATGSSQGSAVFNEGGDRVVVRSNYAADVFAFDPVGGGLGTAPLLTIPLPASEQSSSGREQLALNGDGTRLLVTLPGAVRVFDTATGTLQATIDPSLIAPTGICMADRADTDGDGIDDRRELGFGTDPLDFDGDDDGLWDGFEVEHGLNPGIPGDEGQDPDGDGLDNLREQAEGTDPNDADSDGDGLDDDEELLALATSPRYFDTDRDEVGDGLDNCPLTANTGQEDTRHPNGLGDACDDPDGDGVFDSADNCPDSSNVEQANADADRLGDLCDPYPALSLRVRTQTLLAAPTGTEPTPIRFRLEDASGTLQTGLLGIRFTATVTGSAVFGESVLGTLLGGAGTGRARLEFVAGVAEVALQDALPEVVILGGEDEEGIGLDIQELAIRFRPGAKIDDSLAMIVDHATRQAVVFETRTNAILGTVPFGGGTGIAGDCSLPAELGEGYLTDSGSHLSVVETTTAPPRSAGPPNPVPISNGGTDTALSPDGRFLVACDRSSPSPIAVVDTVRRQQVSTFDLGTTCAAVAVCDDRSVLVAAPQNARVRRLRLEVDGKLTDTGGMLSVSDPVDVACAPGSRSGVVLSGSFTDMWSFTLPGFTPVHFRQLPNSFTGGRSTVINRAGNRVYVRNNIRFAALTLDPGSGSLGAAPLFTRDIFSDPAPYPGMDTLAVDPTGKKLYVAQKGEVGVYDAGTGALRGALRSTAIVTPTGLCTVTLADADSDGLYDGAELIAGTDPGNPDGDGDGLLDGFEVDHGFDPLSPGEQGQDPDADGLPNLAEQSTGTDPRDSDTDDDGLADGLEVLVAGTDPLRADTDADGVFDGTDNCRLTGNSLQEDAVHPNGIGDACDDPDGDDVFDASDDCPDTANSNQVDADVDGLGDACDACPFDPLNDTDGDGICQGVDVCPQLSDPDQLDRDTDEVGDACDICPSVANPVQREAVGCMAFTENGGQCLETVVDLVPGVAQGRLTIPPSTTSFGFSEGQLPGLIDVAAMPAGQYRLCAERQEGSGWSRLLAASSGGQLISINTATGAATFVGTLPSPPTDIEFDPQTGRAFLVANRDLREFDIDTAAAIGPRFDTGVLTSSLEFVGTTLYGSSVNTAGGPGELRIIDPETGATTLVGRTGTNVLTGLAWDEVNQVLYGVTGGTGPSDLVTVNLSTGVATRVGSTGRQAGSLQFGPDGFLYAGGIGGAVGRLDRINPATGAGTLVGISGFGGLTGMTLVKRVDCQTFTKTTEEVLAINGAACGAPTALASAAASIECTSPLGASVTLDGAGSSDPNSTPGTQDDIVSYEWLENPGEASPTLLGTGPLLTVALPLGTHDLALRVTDSFGETDTDEFQVAVVDTVAPAVTLGVTPQVLWPPNHRMIKLDTTPAASDLCSTPVVTLHSITNSEPDDAEGLGDGNTVDDIQKASPGTLDTAFELRAERDGTGNGRWYTVTYRAVDAAGNESFAEVLVTVPHNQDGSSEPLTLSVDEGPSGTVVSWDRVTGALYYNVIRGRVRDIVDGASSIELGAVTCLAARVPGAETAISEAAASPPSGDIFFYLAEYHDGWRGSSYGTAEAHAPAVAGPGACP